MERWTNMGQKLRYYLYFAMDKLQKRYVIVQPLNQVR
jgi:hypothetical protein